MLLLGEIFTPQVAISSNRSRSRTVIHHQVTAGEEVAAVVVLQTDIIIMLNIIMQSPTQVIVYSERVRQLRHTIAATKQTHHQPATVRPVLA